MKKLVFSTLLVLQAMLVFAQRPTGISGKVIDSKTNKPLQNVVTTIENTNLTQLTNAEGKFTITGVSVGRQLLKVKSDGYKEQLLALEILANQVLDLGVVVLEDDTQTQEQQLNMVNLTENDLSDDNSGSETTSGLLQASRDAFQQAAAFNWGQARFNIRGIDNEYSSVLINGTLMNRVSDGRPQYGDWGGLNDATRNQEFTNGTAPSDYVFSGVAGSQHINTKASNYRPGTRISFLTTNTNYSYRAMATHAYALDKKGWAFVVSGGRRWAEQGYFEGTNYSANSLFASVEKRFNAKHSLNLTSFYTENKRGKNSPNTDEITDLVGYKYNSYWGWQDGKKRNSRFKDVQNPMVMLNHYWKITDKTNLNTSVSYQTSRIGNSRLDYMKANNPDPVYYKNLPSYYTTYHSSAGEFLPNPTAADFVKNAFIANPQLDWNDIYRVNKESAEGSKVVQYEDRNDETIFNLNINLSSQINDNVAFTAAANYMDSRSKNFKNLLDLLGGKYYDDISTFGYGDPQQASDQNNMGRTVKVGDQYGYNYNLDAKKYDIFTQFKFNYSAADFYLAQTYSKSIYQREGLYRNGYYPNNSFDKGPEMEFENFGFKGGVTFKLSSRHLLDLNGLYMTKAPNQKDLYPNARVNGTTTEGLTNEKIQSVDASYIIRTPKFKSRITAYYSDILNSTDVNFFYTDNGNGFVNEVVTGINRKNRGLEAGLEYQLTSTIKLTGVAAYGEYTFTNNPLVTLNSDNDPTNSQKLFGSKGQANLAGYRQAGSPQQAYSFGIEYRDPKFWWIGVNGNYLADNYVDISNLARTSSFYKADSITNAVTPIPFDQNIADSFLQQEKLNPFYLVNLTGGKSFRFNKTTLGIFANVNNVLDQVYKTGGFEQSRSATYYDIYRDRKGGGVGPFGTRYFYGYGRTYMVNVSLTF